MKERWLREQVDRYVKEGITKEGLILDLEEAIAFLKSNDFDTTYRLAGGVAQFLIETELTWDETINAYRL